MHKQVPKHFLRPRRDESCQVSQRARRHKSPAVTLLIWARVDSKHGRVRDEAASTRRAGGRALSPQVPSATSREVAPHKPSPWHDPNAVSPARGETSSWPCRAAPGQPLPRGGCSPQACEHSSRWERYLLRQASATRIRLWALLVSLSLTQRRSDASLLDGCWRARTPASGCFYTEP